MYETPLRHEGPSFPAGILPSAPPASASLSDHLAQIRGHDLESPLCKLYERSRSQPAHHHEGDWRGALQGVLDTLRAEGFTRVDSAAMDARIRFMETVSERVFEELRGIKANRSDFYPDRGKVDVPVLAVVFFGSFVRGKPEPGDIDARIVIRHSKAYFVDDFMMGFNESQSAMSGAWRTSETLPKELREGGRPIKIALEVDSHYGEGNGLEFVENCPYVAFVRTNDRVLPYVSTGGNGYRRYREP